ncbi:MAG TPA: zf-TFIIB domain-containing protein [Tepidisphaeraceae bacterium]|jgi:Zn-finger nucleic acid-binding protein|nr:zf-TFIIB domain-containing protein [Tepidisphaeraceae bacterium]
MKCPICKTVALVDSELPQGPASHHCTQCGGHWVESKRYWAWLESPEAKADLPATAGEVHFAVTDSMKAKICPECGHLLSRAKAGHGADFYLDRCSHCGGIWFDAMEWEALRAKGLHDDVHFVFSKAWQAEIARAERQKQHDRLLREKLGDADFAEIQRIKAWLDAHPHRPELYAVLMADAGAAVPAVEHRT